MYVVSSIKARGEVGGGQQIVPQLVEEVDIHIVTPCILKAL
jgi:hypothetical protein